MLSSSTAITTPIQSVEYAAALAEAKELLKLEWIDHEKRYQFFLRLKKYKLSTSEKIACLALQDIQGKTLSMKAAENDTFNLCELVTLKKELVTDRTTADQMCDLLMIQDTSGTTWGMWMGSLVHDKTQAYISLLLHMLDKGAAPQKILSLLMLKNINGLAFQNHLKNGTSVYQYLQLLHSLQKAGIPAKELYALELQGEGRPFIVQPCYNTNDNKILAAQFELILAFVEDGIPADVIHALVGTNYLKQLTEHAMNHINKDPATCYKWAKHGLIPSAFNYHDDTNNKRKAIYAYILTLPLEEKVPALQSMLDCNHPLYRFLVYPFYLDEQKTLQDTLNTAKIELACIQAMKESIKSIKISDINLNLPPINAAIVQRTVVPVSTTAAIVNILNTEIPAIPSHPNAEQIQELFNSEFRNLTALNMGVELPSYLQPAEQQIQTPPADLISFDDIKETKDEIEMTTTLKNVSLFPAKKEELQLVVQEKKQQEKNRMAVFA